jgi:cytochrome c oxidase assembly factor CtaG
VNYLTHHWGYPEITVVAILIVGVHERGLRALNARSTRAHARSRRHRMWVAYAGIALATLSVVSPLQYWSMEYFWVHMIQHVTVMLAAPALYVAGAPAIPLVFALPVATRRRVLRRVFLRPGRPLLRRIGAVVFSPLFAIVFFNVVMVVWMLPSVFNPVMGDPKLHVGLMLTSFFVSGLLFWAQFIPSRPWRPTLSPFARVGALLVTNLVMTIVAMALSFLASGPFYDIGNSMLHLRRLLVLPRAGDGAAFSDQERRQLERHGSRSSGTALDDRGGVPGSRSGRDRHLASGERSLGTDALRA